jgi:SAM-dependent methyltransferase
MLALVENDQSSTVRSPGLPAALASLHAGQVILGMGSRSRLETLLAADSVGPTGKVYELVCSDDRSDTGTAPLTSEETAGEPRTVGAIETLTWDSRRFPLPSNSVDHVISCFAWSQAANKNRFLAEAFRVLKRGGRLTMSDVVLRGTIPQDLRAAIEHALHGVRGALDEFECCVRLARVGFSEISLEPWHVYRIGEIGLLLTEAGLEAERFQSALEGRIMQAHIYARKPRSLPLHPLAASAYKFLLGV